MCAQEIPWKEESNFDYTRYNSGEVERLIILGCEAVLQMARKKTGPQPRFEFMALQKNFGYRTYLPTTAAIAFGASEREGFSFLSAGAS
jgi:hypothetical protein